jgi:hypothetical protein
MSTLAAIGVETWRNNRPLPGAKTQVMASALQFYNDAGPLLRVIYADTKNQPTAALLDSLWRAIQSVGHCQREGTSLNGADDSSSTPLLILGEALAASIDEAGLFPPQLLARAIVLDDPQRVYSMPMLKGSWWEALRRLLERENGTN